MHGSPSSFRGFVLVWLGQVVSLLGSAMTWFALTLWAYELTEKATAVPKEQCARASGMLETAWAASSVLAPMLAGILLGRIGLTGVMTIDIVTFVFAIAALEELAARSQVGPELCKPAKAGIIQTSW